ncbi:glycosyltransferase family 4 protein [Flavobacterium sp.]|uniref:glycosyltransferase family 4 protein n=1 Tax=Flavobacterium sp. TaxID=239 RepID=UPI002614ACA8|nr:glycosyltransferase family 4 protein [Flavobacterium sp.]MDG2431243.1 glycosyltransferase family 4 protein [Flavobacterium sp.]
MKLLYVTNAVHGSGGLERVLSIKASGLADKFGYEVTIMTLNSFGEPLFYAFNKKVQFYDVAVGGQSIQYIKEYIIGVRDVIKKVEPDIICVCDDGLKGFFMPIIVGTKKPIIYERHVSKEIEMHHDGSFFRKCRTRAKWLVMELLAKKFTFFIVLTEGNKKEWTSLKNIRVIANPLSFYPEQSSTLDHKKVIAVGKQSYQKGYDLLLQAWQLVIKKHPSWNLDIYGKKEEDIGLEKFVVQLDLKSSVSFHDPEKDIEKKYLESALYVMSSRYEGFGMVLIEAMACGLPCVSFNCNYGPSDIIANGIDGFLVEQKNYKQLAEKIILLIDNETLRKEMGARAKQNVIRYLPETILNEWDNLFKEIIK